jgi:hypothetical protein
MGKHSPSESVTQSQSCGLAKNTKLLIVCALCIIAYFRAAARSRLSSPGVGGQRSVCFFFLLLFFSKVFNKFRFDFCSFLLFNSNLAFRFCNIHVNCNCITFVPACRFFCKCVFQ